MVREGYKQTDVGVIPEDWEVRTIGETVTLINGRAFKPSDWSTYGVPIIRIQNLNDPMGAYNYYEGAVEERYYVNYGDILFAWSGTKESSFGARMWHGQKAILNQHIFRVIPDKEKITSQYILLALKRFQEEIEKKSHGFKSSFVHIRKSDLENTYLTIPPLPEQRAIAATLSDVDALIASLEKLIAKQRHLKTATMQQLLTGKKRLPGFGGEWDVKRLGDLAYIQRGASPRPIDSPIWFDRNSSVGWVRISDVTRSGMYLRETEQKLSPLGIRHSRPVAKGNLIMSICATVGRPIITEIDVCIHDGFVVFDSLQAEQLFIYYVLQWIEPSWSKQGQTGSQMNLNTELINNTVVCQPPVPEQRAIATVLSDMDAAISALETRRAKTKAIKQGMMQELLTGRTRLV